MFQLLLSLVLVLGSSVEASVQYGPLALANHQAGPGAACDPDFGWLPGPEGSSSPLSSSLEAVSRPRCSMGPWHWQTIRRAPGRPVTLTLAGCRDPRAPISATCSSRHSTLTCAFP